MDFAYPYQDPNEDPENQQPLPSISRCPVLDSKASYGLRVHSRSVAGASLSSFR